MNDRFTQVNNNMDEKFKQLEIDVHNKIQNMEKIVDSTDLEKRRRNIIIYNLPEVENNSQELEEAILKLINQYLKIDFTINEIDFLYRLGKNTGNVTRPTKLGVISERKKQMIMENKNKLRQLQDCRIYLANDLPKKTVERNKLLRMALSQIKIKDPNAKITKNKLISNGIELTDEQMKTVILEQEKKKRNRSEEDDKGVAYGNKQGDRKQRQNLRLDSATNKMNGKQNINQPGTRTSIKKNFKTNLESNSSTTGSTTQEHPNNHKQDI